MALMASAEVWPTILDCGVPPAWGARAWPKMLTEEVDGPGVEGCAMLLKLGHDEQKTISGAQESVVKKRRQAQKWLNDERKRVMR
jgi:hypothetical protein